MPSRPSRRRALPGFGLTLGFTLLYLSVLVLIPFAALAMKTAQAGWPHFWESVSNPRVIASYQLSFGASAVAAAVNGVFGLLTAWVLVRYNFPGKRIVDALVDLPFALPTAVAGIALTAVYVETGMLGALLKPLGIKVAFGPIGVVLALTFVGLPFVVRTLQPVIQDLSAEVEEAAATLGADRWQILRRVVLPTLIPAWTTGTMLAFGRAVGEYGSVVFISGNLPYKTEITPLLIVSNLEEYDYTGAASLGFVMLLGSFAILTVVQLLQAWNRRRLASH